MFLLVKIVTEPIRDNISKVIEWYTNNLGIIEDECEIDVLEISQDIKFNFYGSKKLVDLENIVNIYVNIDACELEHNELAELIANPLKQQFCMYEYTWTILRSVYRYRHDSYNEEQNNRRINYVHDRPDSCLF